MSDQIMDQTTTQVTDAVTQNQEATKTYTQEEFDKHMAGLKHSLTKRFEKQLSELGDLEELKQIRSNMEKQKQEEAIKSGNFEKILQEMAAKKDAEIQKRDQIIKEYRVNTPLLNAASKYRSINPEQVKSLLVNRVTLNEDGNPVALDDRGQPMYNDKGEPVGVDDLVKSFLDANPHFVAASPSTTATKSNANIGNSVEEFDLAKLDLSKPEHREIYRKARAKGLI